MSGGREGVHEREKDGRMWKESERK